MLKLSGKVLLPLKSALDLPLKTARLLLPPRAVLDLTFTISTIATGAAIIYGTAILAETDVINKGSITSVLSVACPLVMMVQYVSPIPVIIDALQNMSAKSLPVPVFQSQAACNILGLAYGIQRTNAAVLVTNMFGLACQILFLSFDHYIRNPRAPIMSWIWFSLKYASMFNSGLYVFARISPLDMLGHAITLFNIVLFASPLAKVGSILRTRDASPLPAGMTSIAVANNALWSLFALMISDVVLLLPSILGYLLSAFQVLVILWCHGLLPFDLGFLLVLCMDHRAEFSKGKVEDETELSATMGKSEQA